MLDRKRRSATNMFLSLDLDSARICLFLESIATPNIQINSEEPALSESHPLLCILKSSFF